MPSVLVAMISNLTKDIGDHQTHQLQFMNASTKMLACKSLDISDYDDSGGTPKSCAEGYKGPLCTICTGFNEDHTTYYAS